MKMYLISDNIDTQIGMRLAGIEGCVAHSPEHIEAEIKKAVSNPEIGILILTEKAGAAVKDYLNNLKLTLHTPLIIEIPDRHGSRDIADSINSLVQESIGLKL
ncbi:MAG: V-type ATP synthase subunit F [Clostridia bacterium]|nr:V-type ATP synthase subunit F [Clostridia bacterium]